MPERVSSDNPSVESVRAMLARAGRTDRPKVALPVDDADQFPADEVVEFALDGRTRYARVTRALDDGLEVRAVYATRSMARERDGRPDEDQNLLVEWADGAGLDLGRSVLVDVVEPGRFYGLRAPGETQVYQVNEAPDEGLADIARQLEETDD